MRNFGHSRCPERHATRNLTDIARRALQVTVHHLRNPNGRDFEVVCVSDISGYKAHGPKVAEHSWYAVPPPPLRTADCRFADEPASPPRPPVPLSSFVPFAPRYSPYLPL